MIIGIIGGTGGMGKGFALRFCKQHQVIIGSRDAERAKTMANEYTDLAKDAYGGDRFGGPDGAITVLTFLQDMPTYLDLNKLDVILQFH